MAGKCFPLWHRNRPFGKISFFIQSKSFNLGFYSGEKWRKSVFQSKGEIEEEVGESTI